MSHAPSDYPEHGYRDELTPAQTRTVRRWLARMAMAFGPGLLFCMTIASRTWIPMLEEDELLAPRPLRPVVLGIVFGALFAALVPMRVSRRGRVALALVLGGVAVAAHVFWA